MLNCRDLTERASDFLDARLPIRVRLQMRMHLLMCRFCREYLRQMALVVRTLRQLSSEQPSEALTGQLLQAFSAERR